MLHIKLERAVDGAPSQIPTLNILTPQHPKSHPWRMIPATEWKLCSICFLSYLWQHMQSLV